MQITVVFVEKLWLHIKKANEVAETFNTELLETVGRTASQCTLVKDTSGNIGMYISRDNK